MTAIQSQRAHEVCRAAVLRRGLTDEHAQWFADALVRTSLAGIDTHGLRLLPLYLRELDEGRSNCRPAMRMLKSEGPTTVLDADDALGTVAGTYAAHLVSERAARHGVGIVSVANSNHFGAASVYGNIIAARGMVGIVTTSAAARMAPFNGRVPLFGTNPICFSAPTGTDRPYVFDMATSQVSYSQIKHFRKQGLSLPLGWGLDCSGEATQEPGEVHALSPLGGYKGQGLAMMVQILSCLLPAMPLDHELEHLDTGSFKAGRRIGHFFLAIDPSRFVDPRWFEQSVAALARVVRETPARRGQQVLVAGDPQTRCAEERKMRGIPMNPDEADAFFAEERLCHAAAPRPAPSRLREKAA
jgi:ureidoglycolate dehydrogenase (NAD+)